MTGTPEFDPAKAHRFFAGDCFNRAWELIEKPSRTPEEDRNMLQLGLASLWHWSQLPAHTVINLSVGHWQVARIYALLGCAAEAGQYARLSLEYSQAAGDYPFYLAYSYEALARAARLAGQADQAAGYLEKARQLVERIPDPDDQKLLLDDLATLA